MATLACEKNLDIRQKSVLSTEGFYENATPEDAEALIGSIYHLYWGGRDVTCVNGIEKIMFLNAIDDDHYPGGGSFTDNSNQFQDAGNYNVTSADSAPKIMYRGVYKVIYHCNLILEKIPESNNERINRVRAEANFLRALAMFDAVRWWGTPPLVDHVLSQDEYYQSNTPTEESIKWILDRMKEAADALPAISGKGQQEAFGARISKHAALAYRGKVGLWYGQKFNDKTILEGAVKDLQTVINSGLYGLIPDMNDLYHTQANGCREYIFENVRKWDTSNLHNDDDAKSAVQDGWYGLQENWLFPYTFVTDGTNTYPFVDQMGWGGMNPTRKVYDAFVAEEGPSSYRRLASCLVLEDLPSFGVKFTNGASWKGNEGVFRFKWLMSLEDEMWNAWTGNLTNTPCMRYADVLLLAAEAAVRGGGGSADAYVNEVRARAKLPAKSGVTFEDVKKERLLELCFEAVRFQDLKRWGDLAKECADKGKKMPTLMASGTVQYVDNPDPAAGFQERDLLLPFPLSEIQTNKALADQQNPGY